MSHQPDQGRAGFWPPLARLATTLGRSFVRGSTAPGGREFFTLTRLGRPLAAVLVLLLALFHVVLLAQRIRDASLAEPAIALRWLLSAALVALALALRRRALPVASGRIGVAFGLVVLLLHIGTVPAPATIGAVEELLVALPMGIASAALIAMAAVGVAIRSRRPRFVRGFPAGRGPQPLAALAHFVPSFLPRPPPA